MKALLYLLLLCWVLLVHSSALPLYTNSRWIVDEEGRRVKLACVNWASHLDGMLAEGLGKQPLDRISKQIASMGFNCVRFTWPLFMFTNDSMANLTVRQSFQNLGLLESISGIEVNNPGIIDVTVIQAFQAVVSNLADNNLMIILDNHISKPGWCCSNFDGSGFFGDKYFDPNIWLKGLSWVAALFNATSHVVAMSLRNELRGPKQNVNDWFRYMQKGAEVVHSNNPNVLVILSGLSYSNDLSFLSNRQVEITFKQKLVFEFHWYGFSDGKAWENGNPNQVCGSVVSNVMRRNGFLVGAGWPLFLSEFGVDERGTNVNDDRFLNCMVGVLADLDLDWALWTLQGSYYLRQGKLSVDETYGLLGWDWSGPRNSSFLKRIETLQLPFQGPGLSDSSPYNIIFHPSTGLCVLHKSLLEPLKLGPCAESEAWNYTPQKTLVLKGTYFCLQADGSSKPVNLGIICTKSNSNWDQISDSKLHLSSKLFDGTSVCLDIDSDNIIITSQCKCLNREKSCDPDSQWFKIVTSTRDLTSRKLPLGVVDSLDIQLTMAENFQVPLENVNDQTETRSAE